MSKHTAYKFGWHKTDRITIQQFAVLKAQTSPPTAEAGLFYFDGTNLKFCADGTNYGTVTVS